MTIYVSYVYLCEGQRLTSGVLLNHVAPYLFIYLFFWGVVFHWTWSSWTWLGWPSFRDPLISALPQPIQYTLVFTWVLRIWIQTNWDISLVHKNSMLKSFKFRSKLKSAVSDLITLESIEIKNKMKIQWLNIYCLQIIFAH